MRELEKYNSLPLKAICQILNMYKGLWRLTLPADRVVFHLVIQRYKTTVKARELSSLAPAEELSKN